MEFYPHRPDEGGVRLQGGFTQRGGDWVAAPDLGRLRDLEPEICRRCGAVLVPDRLWRVFRESHGNNL